MTELSVLSELLSEINLKYKISVEPVTFELGCNQCVLSLHFYCSKKKSILQGVRRSLCEVTRGGARDWLATRK